MPRDSEYGKLLGTQSTSVQSVTKAQHGTWNRHAPCAEFLASFLVFTGCKRVDLRHIALVGLARLGPQVRLRADQAAERHCKHERAARPSRSHRMHPCGVSVSACRFSPCAPSQPDVSTHCHLPLQCPARCTQASLARGATERRGRCGNRLFASCSTAKQAV